MLLSELIGAISTQGPKKIDGRIEGKITLIANSPISSKIAKLFTVCLDATAEQLDNESMLDEITRVTCIFTGDGEISIKLDPEQLGVHMAIIIYPMNKWEEFLVKQADHLVCTMMIEELVHHFWSIEDEIKVNYKVLDVLRHIYPDIKMEDVYNI